MLIFSITHNKFSIHLSVTPTGMYHIKKISFWLVSVDIYIYIFIYRAFYDAVGSHYTGSSAERKNAQ